MTYTNREILNVYFSDATLAVLQRMAELRRTSVSDVAEKIVERECEDSIVVFDPRVPGRVKSKGR